jgi:hypothetical protein
MTQEQQDHVDGLTQTFRMLTTEKYARGAAEHGGNLFDVDVLPLLHMLREEVIDSFVYLQTAIDKLEQKQ